MLVLVLGFALGVVSADGNISPFIARENISPWPFVIVALLIPPTVMYSIKECKKKIEKLSEITDEMFLQKADSAGRTGAAGALFGLFLTRGLLRQVEAAPIIAFVGGVFLALALLSVACAALYKVHLIKKYCPYLENPEGGRYNEDIKFDK